MKIIKKSNKIHQERKIIAIYLIILLITSTNANSAFQTVVHQKSNNDKISSKCLADHIDLEKLRVDSWHLRSLATCSDLLAHDQHMDFNNLKYHNILIIKYENYLNAVLDNMNLEGYWWNKEKKITGDPNLNRFVLLPLLDGFFWLNKNNQDNRIWKSYKEVITKAIKFQYLAYQGKVDWDWGAQARGHYPNQDVYFALIMALASELFHEPKYRARGDEIIHHLKKNLMPDGGFHYIGVENESPVYHELMIAILGRYYTLTGSQEAYDLIKQTVNYWPLIMTAEGVAEGWSDVWLKQGWQTTDINALVIASAVTGDKQNKWLLSQSLKNFPLKKSSLWALYALPFWEKLPQSEEPLPDEFVRYDRNIGGIHGRKDNWYFGFTGENGYKNTFVGGVIGDKSQPSKTNGIFRGAQIAVTENGDSKNQLFLSELDNHLGMSVIDSVGGALCVNYNLQPNRISGIIKTQSLKPVNSWHVTQIWRATKDATIGLVAMQALKDLNQQAVAGKILLGPEAIKQISQDTWVSGQLKIRFYQTIGTVMSKALLTNPIYPSASNQWNGLEMISPKVNYRSGDTLYWSVWIGPVANETPEKIEVLPKFKGWVAEWKKNHQTAIVYNSSSVGNVLQLPWPPSKPYQVWQGNNVLGEAIEYKSNLLSIKSKPMACSFVDSLR